MLNPARIYPMIKKLLFLSIASIIMGGVGLARSYPQNSQPRIEGINSVRLKALENNARTQISHGGVPILMYHYIRDYHDPKDKIETNLSIAPAIFESQLTYLETHGYHAINLDQMEQVFAGKLTVEKPIVLIFDDGYADAYSAAFPALQKHHMIGVFYLVSDFLDTNRYLTKDQVKTIDTAGMEIAAHTVHHIDLEKSLPTPGATANLKTAKTH